MSSVNVIKHLNINAHTKLRVACVTKVAKSFWSRLAKKTPVKDLYMCESKYSLVALNIKT